MKLVSTLAAASLGLFALGGAHAAIVDLEASADTVAVGEAFDVTIAFTSETTEEFLSEVLADFAFNDDLFDFVGADFTDPESGRNELDLPGDPDAFDIGTFSVVQNGAGLLELDLFSPNDPAFLAANQDDDFNVVTLTFVATMIGSGDLGLTAFAEFLAGFDLLEPTFVDRSVTVNVVPLPGAALFVLTGLGALAARRRAG